MMFWRRLRESKLKFHALSNEFKRCYNLNHAPIIANQHISSRTLVPILSNPKFVVQDRKFEIFGNVRYYAAPVQANQKKEKKDTGAPRMNEQITAPAVRLVIDEEDHYIISRYEALARAKNLKLDLVEVDALGKPPVCKILDYNKEKYLQQAKEKERAKSKATLKKGPCKEVRFAAKIKPNDLKIKADMVKRLMENGHRVKCTATDPTNDMDLKTLLSRFYALIEDVAIEESGPNYEKKQAFVVVRHVKFGFKKGSGKKASKAAVSSEGTGKITEAGSESEHADSDEHSEEDVRTNKTKWAVFAGDDDINSVFDINNEDNAPPQSSKHMQSGIESAPNSIESSIPKPAMENRYAKDPRSAKPPRIPTDMNGRGARNPVNSAPPMPNQGNQPHFSMNTSSQTRSSVPVEVLKQNSSGSSTFNKQQVNTVTHEQNAPTATNRYRKNGSSPQRGSPAADPRMNRGIGVRNPTEGKWGVFSTDNSNVNPKKNENQAES